MEPKKKQLVANVEPTIYNAAFTLSLAQGLTMSAYVRKLVLDDLKSEGLLTEAMLEVIL